MPSPHFLLPKGSQPRRAALLFPFPKAPQPRRAQPFAAALFDFVFPKYSLRGAEGEWISASEFAHLVSHPQIFPREDLKRRGIPSLDRMFAVSTYRDAPLLRRAIQTFKYRRMPGLGEALRKLLVGGVTTCFPLRENACLCPVPLHFLRHFHRGFNQAELLARGLSQATGLPLRRLLRRTKPTGHQTGRKREERLRAMRGAFRMRIGLGFGFGLGFGRARRRFLFSGTNPNSNPTPLPFCVYLIDDLFTTGATMEECARVLKQAGVKRVEGIVLAHG